jgi:hypothetical protein
MKRTRRIALGALFLTMVVAVTAVRFSAQTTCNSTTVGFSENFDNATYKDVPNSSVANWPSGPITLNYVGSSFSVAQPQGMGAMIYTAAPGDYDGDGKIDLVGLDIRNGVNQLVFVKNNWNDANRDGVDDDGIVFTADTQHPYETGLTCGPAAICSGDFNNDGLLDFFFMKNDTDQFGYTNFVAAMYINWGTRTNPKFKVHTQSPNLNFSALFQSKNVYINWAANHICAVDIDKDGDLDILAISQDKIFLLTNPGKTNFQLSKFTLTELRYNTKTGYMTALGDGYTQRGGSAIAAGDINGDGFVDIICGSVNNYNYLAIYINDGTGYFRRQDLQIPRPECTGTVGLGLADYNGDGRLDVFGATDAWNAGNQAHMWLFLNQGVGTGGIVQWQFRCLASCNPILPDPHDVDVLATADYTGDGTPDVILADANHAGDYYLVINNQAAVYTLHGEAWSTNVAGELDPDLYAITQVQVTSINQRVIGPVTDSNLKVDLYFSIDGSNWEKYATWTGADIKNYTNLPVYTFLHFGNTLRWKAVLNAGADLGSDYPDSSYETPAIDSISIQYTYVEKQEYARTSVAASIYYPSSQKVSLIIGGTFIFPGWQGQLRAYDISKMQPAAATYSTLETITRSDLNSPTGREITEPNVSIFWDAGALLNDRSASSRVVYTAVKQGGVLQRKDFSAANVSTLEPILQDYQNDTDGLINFVRGEGRAWKLGDINHSNPVIVAPPSGNPLTMGVGYDTFKSQWQSRGLSLYVGANDGMLHCFDVVTGVEKWAFIPYNLLPKLRNMWAVDAVTNERYFRRDAYVDGSPVVADVFCGTPSNSVKQWRTILVCGQGPGIGSIINGGNNYYFALDVTDPDNPSPLWEFTDGTVGETWSIPTIGKVLKSGAETWTAFMGSGYQNFTSTGNEGNVFYAVDLGAGQAFWSFVSSDTDTTHKWPTKVNIVNTIPGSPSSIDMDGNGRLERVYVGDMDGNLFRVDVSIPWTGSSSWAATRLYTDYDNYPIITTPALYTTSAGGAIIPVVYFGTGGSDLAPATGKYSFIALDDGTTPTVEWYLGDSQSLHLPSSKCVGGFVAGEKVWADPKIANYTVFFSTLTGNIESVNPCLSLAGEGKLYARFVQAFGGSASGTSALKGTGGVIDYMELEIKSRSAVTLGDTEMSETGGMKKRQVFIHEFNSTIQKLEQPVGSTLKIKSWREVYKAVR